MSSHQCSMTIQLCMACYNLAGEPYDDTNNINIPESEGVWDIERSGISSDQFLKPLKTKKANIGLSENPKFANIGDYWDDHETVTKITYLLHDFQDLFPTKFSEMKGIVSDFGEMKIPLKPDAKPFKQQPYKLNPRYKKREKNN